jgi:hypothetical protein
MNFKSVLMASAIMAFAAFATGCGDVCEDAAEICGVDDAGDAADEADVECSGAAECQSECIVDADSCDTTDADLLSCITDCGT